MKRYLNTVMNPETPLVHIGSAVTAGKNRSKGDNSILKPKQNYWGEHSRKPKKTQCSVLQYILLLFIFFIEIS